eukprot:sb/3476390/
MAIRHHTHSQRRLFWVAFSAPKTVYFCEPNRKNARFDPIVDRQESLKYETFNFDIKMLAKFEIDWRRFEVAMLWRKTHYRHIYFHTVLTLQTRFETLRNRVSQIRDSVSESIDDYLS